MNVNELKVGNIIMFGASPCIVTTINYRQSDGRYETFFVDLKTKETHASIIGDISGIKLNEAILIGVCGFMKNQDYFIPYKPFYDMENKRGFVLDRDAEVDFIISFMCNAASRFYISRPIKYLHQLQNLLFELKGIELYVNKEHFL